jgi:hypothetical protein
VIVVDDHHLFAVLARQATPEITTAAETSQVFTTATWYYRLARAVHDTSFAGALSRRVASLDPQAQEEVRQQIDALPQAIGLISPRLLVPVMAKVAGPDHLNHLAAEALAVAILTEASITVAASSAHLANACGRLGVELIVLAV